MAMDNIRWEIKAAIRNNVINPCARSVDEIKHKKESSFLDDNIQINFEIDIVIEQKMERNEGCKI